MIPRPLIAWVLLNAPLAPAQEAKKPVAAEVESSLATEGGMIKQFAFDGKPDSYFASATPPTADDHFSLTFDQAVTLKAEAGHYEITTIENGPAGMSHKIVEVGSDYLVVVDLVGVTETRIPVYSIKSFVRLKILKK